MPKLRNGFEMVMFRVISGMGGELSTKEIGGVLMAVLALTICLSSGCRKETLMPPPSGVADADPWKDAAARVEQDRGEPMGRGARVEIPSQVKHYSDSRRFLATQIAESRKHHLRTPHDFAELVQLIRNQELIEVPSVGNGYILYGVGRSASEDRFTHYEATSGKRVILFENEEELKRERETLEAAYKELSATILKLQSDLKRMPRREREARKQLQDEISATQRTITNTKTEREVLDRFYSVPSSRRFLESELQIIASQARQFGEGSYRLDDGISRKTLKARLLSFLRPAALRVLESLAQSYQARFNRPLAITSLVRTEEYQRQLRAGNPNATLVQTPPHSTGLAFDIAYKFMASDEQTFLMGELARLRDEGRIEVLRENNDHFHVFVFINGARPEEKLIEAALEVVGPRPRDASPQAKRQPSRSRKIRPRR